MNISTIKRLLVAITMLVSFAAWAGTPINIVGSDDATAISGYDPVAFFKTKTATVGDQKFSAEYQGVKWLFASAENLQAFQANPEAYVPAWGGHCAWAVSEKQISTKKLSGDFEIIDGKLYLFSYGNSKKTGAKDDFLYGNYGKSNRLRDGEKAWVDIKAKLDDGSLAQPDSKNYRKSRFE